MHAAVAKGQEVSLSATMCSTMVGGGWRLAVGGGWRLAAVGGWRRLVVGGWRLVMDGVCQLVQCWQSKGWWQEATFIYTADSTGIQFEFELIPNESEFP